MLRCRVGAWLRCRTHVGSHRNSSLRADSRRVAAINGARRFAVTHGAQDGPVRGEVLAQISTGLVQLHSRYYGKGPTKAKTHLLDDVVVCVLRGGFTTVERTLLDTGQEESVHQIRRSFQQAMDAEFRRVIEEATDRKVLAYMSSIHADPDLAVELFVLEPLESDSSDGHVGGELAGDEEPSPATQQG
jgi:uncharacterized protein YbcI